MYKLFALAFLAVATAAPAGEATSYASFNDNQNHVQHIQSAPVQHYAAPAVAKVAVPVAAKVAPAYYSAPAAPSYHSAPVASSYYSAPAPVASYYSAPAPAKIAVPVAKKIITVAKQVPQYYEKEEYGPAQYEFAYTIADPHTGDFHSQEEKREGDHVVGQYSLHEADGTVRIVKYSDEGHGFNAVVERQGHPTEAPVYKKVVVAAAPKYHY
uniref:Cuticle protein n=1 Tax=Dendroctonus ponderosae TaxID=77166 RepID=A0AAR5PK00_DENPD